MNYWNYQKVSLRINPPKKLQKRFLRFAKNRYSMRKRKNQFQNLELEQFAKIYLH